MDKMHAYRDAIRDSDGRRVVRYAAILYPGPGRRYSAGIEALPADPAAAEGLERRVADVVEGMVGRVGIASAWGIILRKSNLDFPWTSPFLDIHSLAERCGGGELESMVHHRAGIDLGDTKCWA